MITQSKKINENYAGKVVEIRQITSIEGADRIRLANVCGVNVVVDLTWKEGDLGVFFPMKTCLSPVLLSALNLYSDKSLNNDSSKRGFFNKHGYVTMLKLRGVYSEGFMLKITELATIFPEFKNEAIPVGTIFDTVGDVLIAWKYVKVIEKPESRNVGPKQHWWKRSQRGLKKFDRMIDGQFAYHYDTGQLRDHLGAFLPTDDITLTVKVHGTSVILANILTKTKLNLFQKVVNLVSKEHFPTKTYDVIYSTRRVIQNKYINKNDHKSFYGDGVHGAVYRDFKDYIPEGWTIYGEIAGYKEGSSTYIQKNHDYGCLPGNLVFMPYRITKTKPDGTVEEMPVLEVIKWTDNLKKELQKENPDIAKKLMSMTLIYRGKAGDMYNLWNDLQSAPDGLYQEAVEQWEASENYNPEYIPWRLESFENFLIDTWRAQWIDAMKVDKKMIGMELREPMCKNKVPREGVVIRKIVDVTDPVAKHAYKLKSQAHYHIEMMEDEAGESNIEDEV